MQLQLGAPQRAPAQLGELLAHLLAGQLAGVAAGDQPGARPVHERLHAGRLAAEHGCDVHLGEAADLGQQQRRALLVGQLADVGQQLAQLRALLHLLGEARRGDLGVVLGHLVAGAQHGQAAVARDREQPRLEGDLAVAAALEVAVGRGEGVLDGVLGLLARAEHVAAEGQDPRAVALEGDLEGRVAAAPDLGDEPVVASEAQQAPGSQRPPGCVQVDVSGITHKNAVGAPRFAHNSRTCVLVRR